jgi:hypothetical protein
MNRTTTIPYLVPSVFYPGGGSPSVVRGDDRRRDIWNRDWPEVPATGAALDVSMSGRLGAALETSTAQCLTWNVWRK